MVEGNFAEDMVENIQGEAQKVVNPIIQEESKVIL